MVGLCCFVLNTASYSSLFCPVTPSQLEKDGKQLTKFLFVKPGFESSKLEKLLQTTAAGC